MALERMDRGRRRAWLSAALLSFALLILPLALWLVLPSPPPAAPLPPRARAAPASLAAADEPVPDPAEPPPRPAPDTAAPAAAIAPGDGLVRGAVLDPEGNPVVAAFVSCEDRPASASSDAEGRFELPPEADGCSAVATQAAHSPSERTRLSAGRDNILRLTAGGAIEGAVVDEQGRPVDHYLLAVESFAPSADPKARYGRGARTIDDPTGVFRLEKLPPGRYVLAASAEGRPPARSDGIEVETGRTTHHVRIVLSRGATLSGRVIDAETRAPLEGARVALDAVTSSGANAIPHATTDAAGSYTLEGAPTRGPFSVRVEHPAYMSKIVPGLDARGSSALRSDIELRSRGDGGASEELVGIGATLLPTPDGVTIAGLVEGAPAERAGLQRGDRIVRIDGADATGLALPDCVQRLRGAAGTRVSVTVDREGQPLEVTITREVVVR